MRYVQENLDLLKQFYIECEEYNVIIRIKIKENEYFLEKYEVLEVIEELIHNERYEESLDIINFIIMNYALFDDYEGKKLYKIKKLITEFHLYKKYNIEKFEKNREIKRRNERCKFMMHQYKNFQSFKYNQNYFDNMISIIKIINRLNIENIKTDLKSMIFEEEKENYDEYCKKLLQKSIEEYAIIRFIV